MLVFHCVGTIDCFRDKLNKWLSGSENDQRVVWRSAVPKFSSGGSWFDPSFSKTEKVRVMCIDQIR